MKRYLHLLIVCVLTITCQLHASEFDVRYDANQGVLLRTDSDLSELKWIKINGEQIEIEEEGQELRLELDKDQLHLISIANAAMEECHQLYYISQSAAKRIRLWLSIVPPLLAIGLALIFREVIISLFAGIWVGAFIVNGLSITAFYQSFLNVIDKYVYDALVDGGHISIIVFSVLIGGLVSVISKNGGMNGLVNALSRFANNARSAQLMTWFLGIAIFFDDYANTLIVGNTMRSVTDKFRISREKLAYIVDSTAAPIAAIAFITTWIGAELGYIEDALAMMDISGYSAYEFFINSLKYAYYPVLTICFIFLLVWFKKDYGPMLKIERRARDAGLEVDLKDENQGEVDELQAKAGIKQNWTFAVIPIAALVFTVIGGIIYTGWDTAVWNEGKMGFFSKLQYFVGNGDSYIALLWGSLTGLSLALLMSLFGKKLSLAESMSSMMVGFKTMLTAIVILTLAWSLAAVTEDLFTAQYLIAITPDFLSPKLLPLITFLLAAAISFATGSSWGTMAILYPLILPVTYSLGLDAAYEMDAIVAILFNVTSVVLAGSVFGDHCSPISDTTILSSMASGCNHIEHVRTQLPYALTVGAIAILTGGILFAVGVPWWANYLIGFALIFAAVKFLGKKVDEPSPEPIIN